MPHVTYASDKKALFEVVAFHFRHTRRGNIIYAHNTYMNLINIRVWIVLVQQTLGINRE